MDAGWLAVGTWTVIGPWCAGRWIRPIKPRCCSRPVAASPMWCGRPVGSSGSSPTPPGFRRRIVAAVGGGRGGRRGAGGRGGRGGGGGGGGGGGARRGTAGA